MVVVKLATWGAGGVYSSSVRGDVRAIAGGVLLVGGGVALSALLLHYYSLSQGIGVVVRRPFGVGTAEVVFGLLLLLCFVFLLRALRSGDDCCCCCVARARGAIHVPYHRGDDSATASPTHTTAAIKSQVESEMVAYTRRGDRRRVKWECWLWDVDGRGSDYSRRRARVVVGRLEETAKEEDQVSEMAEKTREEREERERDANYCSEG